MDEDKNLALKLNFVPLHLMDWGVGINGGTISFFKILNELGGGDEKFVTF